MKSPKIEIYQIFYNEETRKAVDHNYIPLDNRTGDRHWYEFYPIKKFLDLNELDDDTYYGFLSPKFYQKTGITSEQLISFIKTNAINNIDVFLSAVHFDQSAYYKNPFDQGEIYHEGLKSLAQQTLDRMEIHVNLDQLVSSTQTNAYCNYIIAKKSYWLAWKKFADKFYELVENDQSALGEKLSSSTSYNGQNAAMRTFIQERFPSIILSTNKFRTLSFGDPTYSQITPIAIFSICNFLKNRYIEQGDPSDLMTFEHLRKLVHLNP